MTPEEAVRRCEFWTTTTNCALGSTRDPEVGTYLNGDEFDWQRWTLGHNGPRGWAIRIDRWAGPEEKRVENALYHLIVKEIERRNGHSLESI
jgi:hypothetical protein